MKYVIIVAFIFVYLFWGIDIGYSLYSPLFTHFTYSFQHTSWLHLLCNSIAFMYLYDILKKALPEFAFLSYSYLIAVAASFFSEHILPTVGSSGVVYAMIGLFVSISIIGKKLKIVDHKKFITYIGLICLSIVLSPIREGVNAICHIIALALGIIIGVLDNRFNK